MPRFKQLPPPLLEALREEECILFLGAGVSANSGIRTWSELLSFASNDLGSSHPQKDLQKLNLLELAQLYEGEFGKRQLVEGVSKQIELPNIKPSANHRQITVLPLNTIITTNWDTLIETAYKENGVQPQVVWKDDQIGTKNTMQPLIVKMHGCITDPNSLVVTERDYLEYLNKHPLMVDLITTRLAHSTVLFLGYGVGDFDLKLIINRIISILGSMKPTFYIFLTNENLTQIDYLRSMGFVPITYSDNKKNKQKLLTEFLQKLGEEVAVIAHKAEDRAKLLVRESDLQLKKADGQMLIRNVANLGGWGTPRFSKNSEPIFDEDSGSQSRSIDRLEWEASITWKEFYRKGARFNCVYCTNSDPMLKKYSVEVSLKRFGVFLKNVEKLDPKQVQIANKGTQMDYSFAVFGDNALMEFHRSSISSRTYDLGYVTRRIYDIKKAQEMFDRQFKKIKESNMEEFRKARFYDFTKTEEENLKEYILWSVKRSIEQIKKTKKDVLGEDEE